MDDIDCNCIILNTELLLRYRNVLERTVVTGSLKDLHIYTCIFDENRRKETMVPILKPCSLNFTGSSPTLHGMHIDICVTEIQVFLSPSKYKMFHKCRVYFLR
ncbi:vacuolar protein sorting-associated protein 13-like [Ctenocephalides felis]|uniref:vacuolar protein sorting-associated protein 13-like n=1 Tax=Ctenocephalides felis TaxID=7515 RepID=UPI000E6E465C|nr:vacuolar protein sorting-associated protein 13-like [Ctenocephalides felis]